MNRPDPASPAGAQRPASPAALWHGARRLRLSWLGLAALLWLGGLAAGFGMVWAYKTTPGAAGTPPPRWPEQSSLARDPARATLLIFLHPHCDCSRASLQQLDQIVQRAGARVSATVLFVRPAGAEAGWERSPLWAAAAAIPGVATRLDVAGAEATRFGALTSGQVLLYSAAGRLLFAGGITGVRGHVGDNAGSSRVLGLLLRGQADQPRARVYGCVLGAAAAGSAS